MLRPLVVVLLCTRNTAGVQYATMVTGVTPAAKCCSSTPNFTQEDHPSSSCSARDDSMDNNQPDLDKKTGGERAQSVARCRFKRPSMRATTRDVTVPTSSSLGYNASGAVERHSVQPDSKTYTQQRAGGYRDQEERQQGGHSPCCPVRSPPD